MKPGVYHDLDMAEYLALPAFSASLVRAIVDRCPRAAWFDSWLNPGRVRTFGDATDVGTIAHAILLEGSRDCVECIDPLDHPAEKTGSIPDGWTNKSIRSARDAARAAGRIPVLKSAMDAIEGMVCSAQSYIESLRFSEPAIWQAFQPDGGESEVTIVWEEDGVLCRCRPDRLSGGNLVIDPKFTNSSAEPDSWGRAQLVRMGYYVSAAFYRRGLRAAFGIEDATYVFLNIETEPPHLCSLVGVDPAAMALGDGKVGLGLELWRQCVKNDEWPGYPARVAYPEIPAWELARWQERTGQDIETGFPYDPAILFGRKAAA